MKKTKTRKGFPLRTSWVSIMAFLSLCCPDCLGQEKGREEDDSHLRPFGIEKKLWQNPKVCGANCLYVFLRLHGRQVAHRELLESIPISTKGTSLRALKEGADRHGLDTAVVRATPEALEKLDLPVIAHMGEGADDHYVVLCEVSGDQVVIVDGSTGLKESWKRKEFERFWSGYLLLAMAPRGGDWLLPIGLASSGLGLVVLGLSWHRNTRERKKKAGAPVSLV